MENIDFITTSIYKLNSILSFHQQKHTNNFIKGIIKCGKASISRISKLFGEKTHTNLNDFFTKNWWDQNKLNEQRIFEFINKDEIFVLITDDTLNKKTGKSMKAVGTFRSKTNNGFEKAHNKVFTGIANSRGEYMPLFLTIYLKEDEAKKENIPFKTKREIAKEHYDKAKKLDITFYAHIYDAGYLSHDMIEFAENQSYIISVLSGAYSFKINGKKIKSSEFKKKIDKRKMTVLHSNNKRIRYIDYNVELTTGKKVKLVFFIDENDNKIKTLISTNLNWSAKRIFQEYAKRNSIEVFFKDCKQNLNLGNCSFKEIIPHKKWDVLVMFTYSILRKFIKTKEAIRLKIKTIGRAVDYFREKIKVKSLFINP